MNRSGVNSAVLEDTKLSHQSSDVALAGFTGEFLFRSRAASHSPPCAQALMAAPNVIVSWGAPEL